MLFRASILTLTGYNSTPFRSIIFGSCQCHAVHIDRKNNVSFVARNGTTYKFNKVDGTVAIITKRGVVITYFKLKDGYDYYKAQIERTRK